MIDVLHGSGVSEGIAIGEVVLLRTATAPVAPSPVPPERIDEEIDRLRRARLQAKRELEDLRERTRAALGDTYAGILEAQLLILDDPKLVAKTESHIRLGRVTASWALRETVGGFLRKFEALEDGYFRERGNDLEDVHQRMQRILRGEQPIRSDFPGEGPHVIVAHSLGPSDSLLLSRRTVAGFATDVGGRTSHTAILAQALSVPAVVGLHDITQRVRTGQPIVVDGGAGTVVLEPDRATLDSAVARRAAFVELESTGRRTERGPARSVDGVEVSVQANVEFLEEVERAIDFGASGIGLYRSEFLFLAKSPNLPSEEEHYRVYREMAERMAPHPVTVRTLDLGGEKYFHEVIDAEESNPVLGLRGVRLCLARPQIFRAQLRGLLRASVHTNLRIMIPLVTVADEIEAVRRLLAEEAASLRADGVACRDDPAVGIMIEVPAAAMTADVLADHADFFSIGTNDLIQYALAVDRGNESVSYLYQPMHPAVIRTLRFVVDAARDKGRPVAVCGEVASDVTMLPLLLGMGLRELSVQPRAVGPVVRAIAEIDVGREAGRFERALRCRTIEEVETLYSIRKGLPRDG